jgi:hypothetical protein
MKQNRVLFFIKFCLGMKHFRLFFVISPLASHDPTTKYTGKNGKKADTLETMDDGARRGSS